MARHFENARRLYHQKLLPQLERTHGRVKELEKLPYDDPKHVPFRNDDRLIKTLLLDTVHDLELSARFQSLLPGFKPQPPVAANLRGASVDVTEE